MSIQLSNIIPIIIFSLISACNFGITNFRGAFAGNGKSGAKEEASESNASVKDSVGENGISGMSFQEKLGLSVRDYFDFATQISLDDPIFINGFVFDDVRSFLLQYESEYLELADRYQKLGDFMKTVGIDSKVDIPLEHYRIGLERLDDLYNQNHEKTLQSLINVSSSTQNNLLMTLKDTFLLGMADLAFYANESGFNLLECADTGYVNADGCRDKKKDFQPHQCCAPAFAGDQNQQAFTDYRNGDSTNRCVSGGAGAGDKCAENRTTGVNPDTNMPINVNPNSGDQKPFEYTPR